MKGLVHEITRTTWESKMLGTEPCDQFPVQLQDILELDTET